MGAQQSRVAAEFVGEAGGPSEDLGEPDGHVLDVGGGEVDEDRREHGVGENTFVEGVAQSAQGVGPADGFDQGFGMLGHAAPPVVGGSDWPVVSTPSFR